MISRGARASKNHILVSRSNDHLLQMSGIQNFSRLLPIISQQFFAHLFYNSLYSLFHVSILIFWTLIFASFRFTKSSNIETYKVKYQKHGQQYISMQKDLNKCVQINFMIYHKFSNAFKANKHKQYRFP